MGARTSSHCYRGILAGTGLKERVDAIPPALGTIEEERLVIQSLCLPPMQEQPVGLLSNVRWFPANVLLRFHLVSPFASSFRSHERRSVMGADFVALKHDGTAISP